MKTALFEVRRPAGLLVLTLVALSLSACNREHVALAHLWVRDTSQSLSLHGSKSVDPRDAERAHYSFTAIHDGEQWEEGGTWSVEGNLFHTYPNKEKYPRATAQMVPYTLSDGTLNVDLYGWGNASYGDEGRQEN